MNKKHEKYKAALNLIGEISRGEHEGWEMTACQDFIDGLDIEDLELIEESSKNQ